VRVNGPTQGGLARAGGWNAVAAYGAVAACTQLLWLTFAPVTTDAARYFGVSEQAVGWLANAFPLLYVVLALPTGHLLDVRPRRVLAAGAVLCAAGGLLRLGDTFAWALAGSALVAVAQPVVLGAITRVVAVSLPPASQAAGIGLASAGTFLGILLALVLGSAFGGGRLPALVAVQAAIAVVSCLWLLSALRRWPAQAPQAGPDAGALAAARESWADRELRRLAYLAAAGFGGFVALTTWLQALVAPAGIDAGAAGTILAAAVAAGVVAALVVPGSVVRAGRERALLLLVLVLAAVSCAAMAATGSIAVVALAACVATGALLVALPVLLDLCERRANAAHAATAANVIWLAGNLGGLVVSVLVGTVVDRPALAFALMAVSLLAGMPLLRKPLLTAPASGTLLEDTI
jgi:predicted MFS family arabinose efflux permease